MRSKSIVAFFSYSKYDKYKNHSYIVILRLIGRIQWQHGWGLGATLPKAQQAPEEFQEGG